MGTAKTWQEEMEEVGRKMRRRHWSDKYAGELTTRAYHVLKLSKANSPEHVAELGYAYWSRVPNCGAHTMRELEVLFNGGAKFARAAKEQSRPYFRASTDALLRELEYRGFTVKKIIEQRE